MKVTPIFLPLWAPDTKSNLENLLLTTPEISLSSTLVLNGEDRTWTIGDENSKGAFTVKLLDMLNPSNVVLNYGRLSGPDSMFEAKNIVKYMQDAIIGNDPQRTSPNHWSQDLLEIFPAEAVAQLVLSKKGIAYFEMPFTTPFPVKGQSSSEETRMGVVLDGKSDSAYLTWRPTRGDSERKILWGDGSLSQNEIDALRGKHSSQYSQFSLPALAQLTMPNGKKSPSVSLLMAYTDERNVNDKNINSRTMTLAGVAMLTRLAFKNHKRFQAQLTNQVINCHFGDALLRSWDYDKTDQRLYETPWDTEEAMIEDIGMLPNVVESINAGAKPLPALINFRDEITKSLTYSQTEDKELTAKVNSPEERAFNEVGMVRLGSKIVGKANTFLYTTAKRPSESEISIR